MIIGVLKEGNEEQRVSLIPEHVELLVRDGHTVYVTTNSGLKSGYLDSEYINAGARVIDNNLECIGKSNLISSINIPTDSNLDHLSNQHLICCHSNIISKPHKAKKIVESGATLFAYEFMRTQKIHTLAPNSRNAAKVAFTNTIKLYNDSKKKIFGGSQYLGKTKVLVIGYGAAGKELARLSVNHGCEVYTLSKENNESEASKLINYDIYTRSNFLNLIKEIDIFYLCTNDPYCESESLIKNSDLGLMKDGAIIVDMSANRGASTEKNKEHFLNQEVFSYEGVIHYTPQNLLSATPVSASKIFSSCIIKHILGIANNKVAKITNKGLTIKSGKLRSTVKVNKTDRNEIKDPFDIIEKEMNMNDAINKKLASVFKDEMVSAEFYKE